MSNKVNKDKFMIDETKSEYIKNAVELFINKENNGFETRYKSWRVCHEFYLKLFKKYKGKTFNDLTENDKQLSLLNLSFYLASWGMYRGSSFVLQYDNSIFQNVVNVILNEKYSILWDLDYKTIKDNKEKVKILLLEIGKDINKNLSEYRSFYNSKSYLKGKDKNEEYISQTLTTKILLGTICCIPAYDTYFSKSISGTFSNFYNDEKIDNLLELIIRNDIFSKLSESKNYPLMKIVDMAYFDIGIEKEFNRYYEKYIMTLKEPTSYDIWKKVVKCIRQFYYKLNENADYDIHVAFKCDKTQVDKFINKYKSKIDNIVLRLRDNND